MPISLMNAPISHKKRFVLPSLWECAWGLLIIAVAMANFFVGKVSLDETEPVTVAIYGTLTPVALAFFRTLTRPATASLKLLAGVLSFLFSQFVTIGNSFYIKQDWSLCFGSKLSIIIWAIQSFCFGYVFYRIVLGCFSLLQHNSFKQESYKFHAFRWFCGLLIVRLIYLLLLYPCVFDIDAAIGLRTFLDPNSAICNHHPIFVQSLHALFFSIGKMMGYRSIGIALLSFILIIFSSGILTYGLTLLAKSGIGRKKTLTIAFIFLLFPFYSFLSVFITKDGLFSYSFLFYLFTLYEIYLTKGECFRHKRFGLLHILSILLLCLTRHQGVYFVLAEFFLLLYCYRQYWEKVLTIHVLPLSLFFYFSNVILPRLDVEPVGKQEIYGTLFHQTANYLRLFPDELSNSERKTIEKILDAEKIKQEFTYNLTDGSKDCYKYNPMSTSDSELLLFRHVDRSSEGSDLKDYRSTWFSLFLRHPLCFIQTTLGVCLGFFYNNGDPLVKVESYWNNLPFTINQDYIFGYYDKYEWIYNKQVMICAKLPVVSWLFAIPYYIWLAIIALALLLYRKEARDIAVFLPMILSSALLLICPYASGRYAFPIVAALPILIIHLLSFNNSQKCLKLLF